MGPLQYTTWFFVLQSTLSRNLFLILHRGLSVGRRRSSVQRPDARPGRRSLSVSSDAAFKRLLYRQFQRSLHQLPDYGLAVPPGQVAQQFLLLRLTDSFILSTDELPSIATGQSNVPANSLACTCLPSSFELATCTLIATAQGKFFLFNLYGRRTLPGHKTLLPGCCHHYLVWLVWPSAIV